MSRMTKAELLKALEPLDDDAVIQVEINDTMAKYHEVWHIDYVKDIVVGKDVQNECTIYCYQ